MSRRRRQAEEASEALDAIAELGQGELELLLAWIADGPARPPESREELEAWARERGYLPSAPTERT
jgi:hypothetical protein